MLSDYYDSLVKLSLAREVSDLDILEPTDLCYIYSVSDDVQDHLKP